MRRARGERHMAATEIRSWPARAASSWRALERMPAYQVPIVLGGALAALVGAVALIGYKVTRANLRNGAVVAGIAGTALIVVAGGMVGLLAGLLVFAGALWGLLKSF